MGIRGPITQEDLDDKKRADWLRVWVEERKLAWTVGLFSGKQRWEMSTYDAGINEHGQLVIKDREFDMEVMLYAKAGVDWHSLTINYRDDGHQDWYEFRPSVEYHAWLAAQKAQEAEEVQTGGCWYDWCSEPKGHASGPMRTPHKRRDGKRILGDVPQA